MKFQNGVFYKPGITQRVQVHIHGVPNELEAPVYGFQLSARMASDPAREAGGQFRAVEAGTWVQCADGDTPRDNGCRPGHEIQYVQHLSPSRTPIWEVEWTPPAGAAGPIQFFVAANAANGRGDQAGDRIYTHSFTVHPAGLVTARHVMEAGTVSPLSWIRVQGPFSEDGEVRIAGAVAQQTLLLGPGEMLALVPPGTPVGRQTLRAVEFESQIDIQKSSPEISHPSLPADLTGGEPAQLLVFGCGEAPEKASVWMSNQLIAATVTPSEGWPGACRLQFTVPRVSPGETLIRACLDGACSLGRTTVRIR